MTRSSTGKNDPPAPGAVHPKRTSADVQVPGVAGGGAVRADDIDLQGHGVIDERRDVRHADMHRLTADAFLGEQHGVESRRRFAPDRIKLHHDTDLGARYADAVALDGDILSTIDWNDFRSAVDGGSVGGDICARHDLIVTCSRRYRREHGRCYRATN